MLNSYDRLSEVLPLITNTGISYHEMLSFDAPTALAVNGVAAKRTGIIPQLVLASSVLWTAPAIMTFPAVGADSANLSSTRIKYGETGLLGKRISLREARRIALRASKLTEDGLRADRAQEARIMASIANEDEDA